MSDNSYSQARRTAEMIADLMARLERAERDDTDDRDDVEEELHTFPLSVEVRDPSWRLPNDAGNEPPSEYRIVTTTGGPHVEIWGRLDQHGEPESAGVRHQDWHEAMQGPIPPPEGTADALLSFAARFYYGG